MLTDLFCLQHLKLGWWAPIRESLKSDFWLWPRIYCPTTKCLRKWGISEINLEDLRFWVWEPLGSSWRVYEHAHSANPSFGSVQSLNRVWLFVTSWTAAHQASLSITNSWSLLKLMSIKSLMPSNYLILCHPLLLLPSIFLSIRVFSNESALCIRYQSIGVSDWS